MCLAQFFGDLSPFQIIVSVIALLTAGYTCCKSWIEKAKISLYLGDAVRVVNSENGSFSVFHLMCNFVNKSTKVGTVHRLEVRVSGPRNFTCNFVWNLFYTYQAGGQSVEKQTDPYPVAVPQKDSRLVFVGFRTEANQIKRWKKGMYEFKVIGWVNRKERGQPSNLESIFHIRVKQEHISQLCQPNPPERPVFITIPVIEWERKHA